MCCCMGSDNVRVPMFSGTPYNRYRFFLFRQIINMYLEAAVVGALSFILAALMGVLQIRSPLLF